MSNKGFTLAETLIVLIATATVLLLGVRVAAVRTDNYELRFFVKEFLSEVENAQNTAVITGKAVIVERKTANGRPVYDFTQDTASDAAHYKRLVLPDGADATKFANFWIHSETGYIPPSTINFWNRQLNFRIAFQFGLGRYEVEETRK